MRLKHVSLYISLLLRGQVSRGQRPAVLRSRGHPRTSADNPLSFFFRRFFCLVPSHRPAFLRSSLSPWSVPSIIPGQAAVDLYDYRRLLWILHGCDLRHPITSISKYLYLFAQLSQAIYLEATQDTLK